MINHHLNSCFREKYNKNTQSNFNLHLPNEIKKSIHYDIKVRPFEYLKGMLYMNSVLEKQESKLFQPLPLRNNIIPKHIILDTACIINLFCPEKDKEGNKIKKGELLSNVKDNQNEVWSNLLNLNHRIFKNKHYQFHNQIQTDGISCCLLFIRKDLKDKKWGSRVPVLQEQDFYNIEDLSKDITNIVEERRVSEDYIFNLEPIVDMINEDASFDEEMEQKTKIDVISDFSELGLWLIEAADSSGDYEEIAI